MELAPAKAIADTYVERLAPYCERPPRIAGSIRRERPQVGDIEVVCIPKLITVPDGLFDKIVRDPGFAAVFEGIEVVKGDLDTGKYIQLLLPEGIKLDLFTATQDNWGFIYAIRTGSVEFSKFLGMRWTSRGYRGIDGYMTRDGEIVPTPTEEGFFEMLGVPWVPPQEREQMGLPAGKLHDGGGNAEI